MNITETLNRLIDKQSLTTKEAKALLLTIMNEDVSQSQIAAILIALRMKGETVDELVGFIQAMREQMVRVTVKRAIDVCGTGGDGSNSFNISTAVAFVVAGCGVTVAKHGNRAASSNCGSADVLESLGVNIQLTATQAEKVIQATGMVFLFAPLFHPATKKVAMVRKELKIRTIFNFLGPFLNPASVTNQLIGVPTKEIAEKLLAVGKELGYKHLVLVTSEDGMDEVSIFAKTHVFALKNNKEKRFVIDPKIYGSTKYTRNEIRGGTAIDNAEFLKEILQGVRNAKREIVILNSAVALCAADEVSDINEGIKRAEALIASGAAKKVLENVIKETQKYA